MHSLHARIRYISAFFHLQLFSITDQTKKHGTDEKELFDRRGACAGGTISWEIRGTGNALTRHNKQKLAVC
jgi:hypothetical protein